MSSSRMGGAKRNPSLTVDGLVGYALTRFTHPTSIKFMNKWTKRFLFILPLLLAVGGYFIYQSFFAKDLEQQYRTDVVKKDAITQTVSANGTLNPVTLVSVGTQVSGTVKNLYVDFNSKVDKGQVLLELDNSLHTAQIKQSEANVQNARAALELAHANETRLRSLIAQEYISKQELDQAIQTRKSAQAQLALAQAQLEKDRVNLSYTVIRSPVSGVVVDRQVDVGQTVAASFQTPTLIKIAQDLSKMQIDSNFAEADIGTIQVGQSVRFNVDAFPNRAFRGNVKQIRLNPTTQQNVVTYNVVVAVDNPDQILLPGMTAYVTIVVAQRKEALLVPNAALRYRPATALSKEERKVGEGKAPPKKRDAATGVVYVLAEEKIKPVSITLGITDNRYTEILSGDISPGDRVVIGDARETPSAGGGGAPRVRIF